MTRPQRIAPGTSLLALVRTLRAELASGADRLDLEVPDPDVPGGPVAGGWRGWCDLAEALGCRLEAPVPSDDGRVRLRLRMLPPEAAWHAAGGAAPERRYADPEGFASVRKLDHPGFALPLLEALGRVRPPDGGRVLVLGCHRGDEIVALAALDPSPRDLDLVGVDRAPAPLAQARARFPGARFVEADVARLPDDVGRFDLIVAVAVLQSSAIDDRALLRDLVQRHLTPTGGLLLGVPNSRFRGDDVVWGARTRNYAAVDLSLLVSDLAVYRRYLHQHRFRTHVGGRYDLLLTAWRPRGGAGAGPGDRHVDAGDARDDLGGAGAGGEGAAA